MDSKHNVNVNVNVKRCYVCKEDYNDDFIECYDALNNVSLYACESCSSKSHGCNLCEEPFQPYETTFIYNHLSVCNKCNDIINTLLSEKIIKIT